MGILRAITFTLAIIGGGVGLLLIVGSAILFPPSLLVLVAMGWWVFRPITKRERRWAQVRHARIHPIKRGRMNMPHHARPPAPSALDNPEWL